MRPQVCMDWYIYHPWRDNWRKRWFMVFDRPLCNNLEVPQYFLQKLWAEFELGYHVNYFDINEFQGVGLGSSPVQPQAHRNPLRGPPAPRREPNPPPQPPGFGSGLDEIHDSIRCATHDLLRHTKCVAMSSQSREDIDETQTAAQSMGGGQDMPGIGGSQEGPSSFAGTTAHRCSHCGHSCHGYTQQHATGSFMDQLFGDGSPSPRWEDVGSFDLDGAMATAEDIAAPYTQVSLSSSDQPPPPGTNSSPRAQVRAPRPASAVIRPSLTFRPPYMTVVSPSIHGPFSNPFHPAPPSYTAPQFHPTPLYVSYPAPPSY